MNLDFIAGPLGQFLMFIYKTVAFENYGLALVIFTIVVKLVLLPLTLKQYKSSAKMQELQPIIADLQKRYRDDKEKLNQELMKVYQENNYNPASGCLPLLIQMPILLSLYWVISQPLKFMLRKPAETINTLVEFARTQLGVTAAQFGNQRELLTLNFFHDNPDALSKVPGLLDRSELINFNNFLGLHLGRTPKYQLGALFGEEAYIYIPLFILVIVAVAATFISTRIAMPRNTNDNKKQDAPGAGMANGMMYIGPIMTLVFGFQLPAGVLLYWTVGYIFTIFQQLYINKYVLKRGKKQDEE
jgi:YidC/Oxa1 family membrane protein insertase